MSRPQLLWGLAAVFAIRDVVFTALAPDRPDVRNFWEAGRLLFSHPGALYPLTAQLIVRGQGMIPSGPPGFMGPPPLLFLTLPADLLPEPAAVALWPYFDALGGVLAVVILYRALRPRHRLAAPMVALVTAYFPPFFADLDLGNRSALIMLFAVAAMAWEPARPLLAGALAGIASTFKFYPAALAIGVEPAKRIRFWAAAAASFAVVMLVSFVPLGNPLFYLRNILVPGFGVNTPDCGTSSVRGLWMRSIGGEAFALPAANGIRYVTTPVHLPLLATGLADLTLVTVLAAAVWAAWRSGWSPFYGMSLGFALGALIPGEVYPYQFLPLLPLVLVVGLRALELGRWAVLGLLAVALLGFLRQPCDLPFPNLWSVAALGVFGICVWENRLFRQSLPTYR